MDYQNKLAEELLKANVISKETMLVALQDQKRKKNETPLQVYLVEVGLVPELDMAKAVSALTGVEMVDLYNLQVADNVLSLVPRHICLNHHVLPIAIQRGVLTCACTDPLDVSLQDLIKLVTGFEMRAVIAPRTHIEEAIKRLYTLGGNVKALAMITEDIPEALKEVEFLDANVDEDGGDPEEKSTDHNRAPIIKLVNHIIYDAIEVKASDIHMEPGEKGLCVRYRQDGLLRDIVTLPTTIMRSIISRVKLMGAMDISERRKPQDGRASIKVKGRFIDIRMSALPCHFGEKLVLRILDKQKVMLSLDTLGFLPHDLEHFRQFLAMSQGMIILTGPTGSGKTSTLYAALHHINNRDINIVTVEDPIEFQLPGINQVHVNPKAGVTFANALRSILRQDPNVIMVGEIRDQETAAIAAQAAMTGHLVFSTVHTNDAPSSISRLIHMGLEAYLVAASLITVMAQRLARRVCSHCMDETQPAEFLMHRLRLIAPASVPQQFFQGRGCEKCSFRGYSGRIGLYEIMSVTDNIRDAIHGEMPIAELSELARKEGMSSLVEDGLLKVAQGITTLDEVFRVCPLEVKGRAASASWSVDIPLSHPDIIASPTLEALPPSPKQQPLPEVAAHSDERPSSAVLVVDTDVVLCELLREVLVSHRYSVNVADSAVAAFECLRKQPPQLVILGAGLPNGGTTNVLEKLKGKDGGDIPVLVLTSRGRDGEQDAMKGDDFLPKPVNLTRLLEHVERLLSREPAAKR